MSQGKQDGSIGPSLWTGEDQVTTFVNTIVWVEAASVMSPIPSSTHVVQLPAGTSPAKAMLLLHHLSFFECWRQSEAVHCSLGSLS